MGEHVDEGDVLLGQFVNGVGDICLPCVFFLGGLGGEVDGRSEVGKRRWLECVSDDGVVWEEGGLSLLDSCYVGREVLISRTWVVLVMMSSWRLAMVKWA